MYVEIMTLCSSVSLPIPPHTTHTLLPLDVAVFKSSKDNFSKSAHALSFTKKSFVISKQEFSTV